MTSAAKISLRLAFFLAIASQAQQAVTQDPVQIAEEEAVRRQEATIQLHMKLEEAIAAQKRGQLADAGKIYQEAVALIPYVQVGNAAVDLEKKEALGGLDGVREKLARQAMARGEMAEALQQVQTALKWDPTNEKLRKLQAQIEEQTVAMQGTVPSPDLVKTVSAIKKEQIDIATQVQNAKLLYEMGKYDEAQTILNEVLKVDPSNVAAPYYMDLVKEAKFEANARVRESVAKSAMGQVEKAWIPPTKQESLPIPNPMAGTNLVYTTEGRQKILSKLNRIRLNEVSYDLPLTEVLNRLRVESQKRDPDGEGINFMVNPHADASAGAIAPTDAGGGAAAGAVGVVAPSPAVDMSTITIRIAPPLNNLRLIDVLDAITKVADQPIRFTIEDYAVVFSPKPPEAVALYTKVFKVDPNTFVQGLDRSA